MICASVDDLSDIDDLDQMKKLLNVVSGAVSVTVEKRLDVAL